jgi:hypothetical protein
VLKVDSITDKVWEPNFTISASWLRVIFPRPWLYHLHIYYPMGTSRRKFNTYVWTDKQWTIDTDIWEFGFIQHEKELNLSFKKWEALSISATTILEEWWSWTAAPGCTIDINRLWN